MEATAFFAEGGSFDNEIADCDKVSKFAKLGGNFGGSVELFGFYEQQIKAHHSTGKADVGANNAHIIAHNLLKLFQALSD